MFSKSSHFWNDNRVEIEGTFNVTSAGAVITQSNGDGSTFTVTGQGMSVAKTGTGAYQVTVACANAQQGPVFQAVQLLGADAAFISSSYGGAFLASVSSVTTQAATGYLLINVQLSTAAGVAADTTVATTVQFSVTVCKDRMAMPL